MVKLLIGNPSGPSRSVWTDLTGMVASIGCAIHCAAMPFVISYLPSMGLSWIASESFHQWMAVICFVIGIMAFVPGWKRHRKFTPMMLGTAGVAGLAQGAGPQ